MYGNTAERKSIEKAVEIAREIRARERFNKVDFYDPYPYQKNFHDTGGHANQRLLMAANRIGKVTAEPQSLHITVLGYIPSGGKAVDIHSL